MSQRYLDNLANPALFQQYAYIDGRFVDADSGGRTSIFNPATGACIGTVPEMGTLEAERAVSVASAALEGWKTRTAKDRAQILRRWYDLIMANQDDLATILTSEQGKPLSESRGEIAYAASFVEWFGEEAKRVTGDVVPAPTPGKRMLILRQPIGVCAAITPWNFPAAMVTRKVAPALAAGCTIVLKPAPQTPFTALALCVLAEQAGVPAGVFSCITGSAPEIGTVMTKSPIVRKLTFTGSTAIGKLLLEQCASTVKKTSMELGGNAPFIVFDDADLDEAVHGALLAKYRNAGQACIAANRILVQRNVYAQFANRFAKAASMLQVGSGFDPDTSIGPLIDDAALAKAQTHVADAVARGAQVLTGGARIGDQGTFFPPTVLGAANRSMLIYREEAFSPIAPLFSFETEEEAIAMANDTTSGLAAYFYGRDIGRIWRVAEQLDYGMIGVNEAAISNEMAPFGGMKESGLGREGSKYGIDDYLEIKYVCMGGLSPSIVQHA